MFKCSSIYSMEIYIYGKIKTKTKIMSSEDGYHHLIQHQALTHRHFLQWRGGTNSKISTPAIISTIGQMPTPMITNSEIHLFHQTQGFFYKVKKGTVFFLQGTLPYFHWIESFFSSHLTILVLRFYKSFLPLFSSLVWLLNTISTLLPPAL